MTDFKLDILGCSSAFPTPLRNPSAQVLERDRRLFLIDCGEGTQAMMRRMGLSFNNVTHVFLSHMHGDHCLGLPGLLSTLSLHGCQGKVVVTLPASGEKIMRDMLDFFCRETSFEVEFQPVEGPGGPVLDLPAIAVEAFPLYHRVPCVGYIVREKPGLRHLRGDMVQFLGIPVSQLQAIKEGADYTTPDGRHFANEQLTTPATPAMSYAYCSDTRYDERVAESVRGVDVIYHEATYTDESVGKAHSRFHSTATEAAQIARAAGARLLVLGHYSKSYVSEEEHLRQARAIFPNTIAANEGMRIDIATANA